MKKEVIYFDAGAFGPFAKCELFPKTFKKFVDELNKLFETKIAYWDL